MKTNAERGRYIIMLSSLFTFINQTILYLPKILAVIVKREILKSWTAGRSKEHLLIIYGQISSKAEVTQIYKALCFLESDN